jgi:hypothetical protein
LREGLVMSSIEALIKRLKGTAMVSETDVPTLPSHDHRFYEFAGGPNGLWS